MAVIINEFEVMPERPDESPAGGQQAERPQPAPQAMTTVELERMMRQLHERLERVRAH